MFFRIKLNKVFNDQTNVQLQNMKQKNFSLKSKFERIVVLI